MVQSISLMSTLNPPTLLFLYVPLIAGHSPLQPLPQHEAKWRREFCGMIVGADKAIGSVLTHAKERLRENLIVVVMSDNGGSIWFGGSNKATGLEGGTRVAALARDFTAASQRYLGYHDASVLSRYGVALFVSRLSWYHLMLCLMCRNVMCQQKSLEWPEGLGVIY